MTREEAIKYLQDIGIRFVPIDQYGDYDDPRPYEEAIDMAIEALKDRPEEVHEDLWVCPRCGFVTEHNVCPNCGADNRGEEE